MRRAGLSASAELLVLTLLAISFYRAASDATAIYSTHFLLCIKSRTQIAETYTNNQQRTTQTSWKTEKAQTVQLGAANRRN